jgi:hypothetical protein
MRLTLLSAVAAIALTLPIPAAAQDGDRVPVRYWPKREIGFPVPPYVLEMNPRPAKLRLYAARAGGRFEQVAERAVNALDPIDNRPPGFVYQAKDDGEEEFAVQLVYDDGTVQPRTENLPTEARVIFDTRPPVIQIAANGRYGVEWSISDENLNPDSIRLECRWSGTRNWYEPPLRSALRPRDGYTWDSLAGERRTLEVRVLAEDKATNKASSRIITLPAAGTSAGLRDFDPLTSRPADLTDRGGSRRTLTDDVPAAPPIVYVNTKELSIKSKLMHVTRSGVAAVHLFVKDMTTNTNGEWKFYKKQECNIPYDTPDPMVEISYVAPKDGLYGFIVIPESGVGRREPDPRPNSPAQQLVEVDTVPPTVKIKNVMVSPGGAIGPRVEIEWDADDRNLMPSPILLEYATEKTAQVWTSIAEKVPNSRRYAWEVADKTLFKIYIRIRAVDKAGNTGEHIYEKDVIIDLDRPSATIENVRPTGAPGASPSVSPLAPDVGRSPSGIPDLQVPPPITGR